MEIFLPNKNISILNPALYHSSISPSPFSCLAEHITCLNCHRAFTPQAKTIVFFSNSGVLLELARQIPINIKKNLIKINQNSAGFYSVNACSQDTSMECRMHKTRRKYRFIQWRLWGFSGKKQCFVILILLQCKWAFYSGAAWLVNEPHNWCSLKCRGSDHFTSIQIHSAHSKHHRELGSLLPQTNVLS